MTRSRQLAVAVLAAGKGTRMRSNLPKALQVLGGRSLIEWVLRGICDLEVERVFVIVGYEADKVKACLGEQKGVEFINQDEQLGTGHAVRQVLPHLEDFEGDLLVLNGDVPLIRPHSLKEMVETHQHHQNAATVLVARVPDPRGYGRVFCDENGTIQYIIEDQDCDSKQKQNDCINTGIFCFHWSELVQTLPMLSNDNMKEEYRLAEAVHYLRPAAPVSVEDYQEGIGINNLKQLAEASKILQTRQKDKWMMQGVTFIDPDSVTLDDTVQLGPNTIIEPQTHLRGHTIIGAGCRIGPGSLIENSTIGNGVSVMFSVITDSVVGSSTRIGPYAHLRGNAQVGESCGVGNFVELKKATLGTGSMVAHLSYLGDAELGTKVNVGAGTITANYDGRNKHMTVIGDNSKTGSNSVLVAPVNIGRNVTIGAGSTVTEDVQDEALVIARARQTVKPGWKPKYLR